MTGKRLHGQIVCDNGDEKGDDDKGVGDGNDDKDDDSDKNVVVVVVVLMMLKATQCKAGRSDGMAGPPGVQPMQA
jgi:hypothetical protein